MSSIKEREREQLSSHSLILKDRVFWEKSLDWIVLSYLARPGACVSVWWCTAVAPVVEHSLERWPIDAACSRLQTRRPSSNSNASALFQHSDDSECPGRWCGNTCKIWYKNTLFFNNNQTKHCMYKARPLCLKSTFHTARSFRLHGANMWYLILYMLELRKTIVIIQFTGAWRCRYIFSRSCWDISQ